MASEVSTSTATTNLLEVVSTTTKCTKHLQAAVTVDHSAHGGTFHDMMSMSFHFGYTETILFDFWKTDSVTIFLLSCLILFIMAALYEGLKLIREKLIRDEIIRNQQIDVLHANTLTSACHCKNHDSTNKNGAEQDALLAARSPSNGKTSAAEHNDDDAVVTVVTSTNAPQDCCRTKNANATRVTEDDESKLIVMKSYRTRLLSQGHLIQTFLHMFQITVSYLLMLVFMTYNTWLCLSVVLGAGLGYFLFGLKRLTTIDVNEHCH